jgi:hypothetical protein
MAPLDHYQDFICGNLLLVSFEHIRYKRIRNTVYKYVIVGFCYPRGIIPRVSFDCHTIIETKFKRPNTRQ